jgi:hypothetical protein
MEITFDREMKANRYSIGIGAKGEKALPKIGEVHFSEDKKTLFISLQLEPNKSYQFMLSGRNFVSEDGFGITDYEVNFKTKKK